MPLRLGRLSFPMVDMWVMDKIVGWKMKPGHAIQGNSLDFLKLSDMTLSYKSQYCIIVRWDVPKIEKISIPNGGHVNDGQNCRLAIETRTCNPG